MTRMCHHTTLTLNWTHKTVRQTRNILFSIFAEQTSSNLLKSHILQQMKTQELQTHFVIDFVCKGQFKRRKVSAHEWGHFAFAFPSWMPWKTQNHQSAGGQNHEFALKTFELLRLDGVCATIVMMCVARKQRQSSETAETNNALKTTKSNSKSQSPHAHLTSRTLCLASSIHRIT